jgi:hypothetical protein
VYPIICAASAPLQSVLSRIKSTAPAGEAHEQTFRLLLAFVLLGAVAAAATVLAPAARPPRDQVG